MKLYGSSALLFMYVGFLLEGTFQCAPAAVQTRGLDNQAKPVDIAGHTDKSDHEDDDDKIHQTKHHDLGFDEASTPFPIDAIEADIEDVFINLDTRDNDKSDSDMEDDEYHGDPEESSKAPHYSQILEHMIDQIEKGHVNVDAMNHWMQQLTDALVRNEVTAEQMAEMNRQLGEISAALGLDLDYCCLLGKR